MKEHEIYQTVWKRYLPIIAMKLKQVIRNNQSSYVGMYAFEFYTPGKKKKTGHQFNLDLNKGRVMNDISGSLAAKELKDILKQDAVISSLLNSGHFTFNLSTDFVFTIQRKEEVAS